MGGASITVDFKEVSQALAYEILVATVQPRPIAFVSTVSSSGHLNLAPFSFFMVGGSNPPSLAFSPTLSGRGSKDTLRNIEETGEFVVNLVHREIAVHMNQTSKSYAPEISEWEDSGLTQQPSTFVAPPRVGECLVNFECRLFQVISHGDGAGSSRYVIGEVLAAHMGESIWDGEHVIAERFRPIARMGGPNYVDTDALEIFTMLRPV